MKTLQLHIDRITQTSSDYQNSLYKFMYTDATALLNIHFWLRVQMIHRTTADVACYRLLVSEDR